MRNIRDLGTEREFYAVFRRVFGESQRQLIGAVPAVGA